MRIVGLVVEFSPATRGARVRFPDDAMFLFFKVEKLVYFQIVNRIDHDLLSVYTVFSSL